MCAGDQPALLSEEWWASQISQRVHEVLSSPAWQKSTVFLGELLKMTDAAGKPLWDFTKALPFVGRGLFASAQGQRWRR